MPGSEADTWVELKTKLHSELKRIMAKQLNMVDREVADELRAGGIPTLRTVDDDSPPTRPPDKA